MVSVSCFGVRFSAMFHFMFVLILLVQFGLLSGHLLGNILRELNLAIFEKAGCISDLLIEWEII